MLSPGDRIGPYRLGALLGKGGMGAVYRAFREVQLPGGGTAIREVGLKVVSLDAPNGPDLRRRFAREVALGLRVDHPGVLAATDAGEDWERHLAWAEMRLAVGVSLRFLVGRLAEEGRYLSAHAAASVLVEVLGPLGYLHGLSPPILHRDVSSDNVQVGDDGSVALLDLGIAVADDAEVLTGLQIRPGKPSHLSPEFLRDARSIDARHDLYAVGAVLYGILSGGASPIPDGALRFAPETEIIPLGDRRQPLPPTVQILEGATRMLLEYGRDQRPENAEDAIDLLASAVGGIHAVQARRERIAAVASIHRVVDQGNGACVHIDPREMTRRATSGPHGAGTAVLRCPTATVVAVRGH